MNCVAHLCPPALPVFRRHLAPLLAASLLAPGPLGAQVNTVDPPITNPGNVLGAGERGGGVEGQCNVPTDGAPSPLFGAEPFTL